MIEDICIEKETCIKTDYLREACERTKKRYPEIYNLIVKQKFLENPCRLMDEPWNSSLNKKLFVNWLKYEEFLVEPFGIATGFVFHFVSPTALIECLRNPDENGLFSLKRILRDKTLTEKGKAVLEKRVFQYVERHRIEDFILANSANLDEMYCSDGYEEVKLAFLLKHYEKLDQAALLVYSIAMYAWGRSSWVLLEATRQKAEGRFLRLIRAIAKDYTKRSGLRI